MFVSTKTVINQCTDGVTFSMIIAYCHVAELMNMIQEERRKAYQSKEVRTEYHNTLIEVEKWLSKAGQATAHHKDDTSQQTSQAIKVRFSS